MAKRCFSNQQLYALRNDIDVRMLIEKTLRIPCRVSGGCFRFLCPLCNGFDTAVNPKTNLARCFQCKKNFNTIDLVMLIRHANFVQSVRFLQSIHQKASGSHDRGSLEKISGSNLQGGSRMKRKTPSVKSKSGLCHIGKILDSVMPSQHADTIKERSADYRPSKPVASHIRDGEDRIAKLERQLEYLGHQIEIITRTINAGPPSK